MFTLRRAVPALARRGIATVTVEAPAATAGRRRRKQPPKRPDISLKAPRTWNRPLAPGVVPAYDLALAEITRDSNVIKKEAAQLRTLFKTKQDAYAASADADLNGEIEAILQKLSILDVQSEVNLPWVRWKVNNAMADMAVPSHRHLVEQKWRKDGDLDLLMERLYQMNVVPDVLPAINPSLDLHLVVRARSSQFIEENKRNTHVEPGVFIKPKQTIEPPKLRVNVFHPDTRLYTMLMVDPDVPDPENQTYTSFLHWLKPNIPLSTSSQNLLDLNTHTTYIPPHPQQGTPYHRYVILLLPQPPLGASEYTLAAASRTTPESTTSVTLDIPVVPMEQRRGFDVRAFAQRWNLDGAKGGGAHMFREVWDEEVSKIYQTILDTPEPRFGRPQKVDAYAHLKETKKYIM
ncbi:hypothetical protein HYPSUDRAFT_487273 [Hypholoma sublateritium FD-334 SS-4]|uniref:PEBP-like protein n=1 Tax=Hypholoma sublateritium (strain FD-334 SS-4) TaxID=945553 RepID=A0A0D2PL52_HYPSF|nr:hypothetical protein HYPSUDRAFT_487273 [Hypholoma sublateritium FD-334 SS-4]